MTRNNEEIGKAVIANFATGGIYGRGKIIAYCFAPTYVIERDDGTRFNWRCDLCNVQQQEDEEETE